MQTKGNELIVGNPDISSVRYFLESIFHEKYRNRRCQEEGPRRLYLFVSQYREKVLNACSKFCDEFACTSSCLFPGTSLKVNEEADYDCTFTVSQKHKLGSSDSSHFINVLKLSSSNLTSDFADKVEKVLEFSDIVFLSTELLLNLFRTGFFSAAAGKKHHQISAILFDYESIGEDLLQFIGECYWPDQKSETSKPSLPHMSVIMKVPHVADSIIADFVEIPKLSGLEEIQQTIIVDPEKTTIKDDWDRLSEFTEEIGDLNEPLLLDDRIEDVKIEDKIDQIEDEIEDEIDRIEDKIEDKIDQIEEKVDQESPCNTETPPESSIKEPLNNCISESFLQWLMEIRFMGKFSIEKSSLEIKKILDERLRSMEPAQTRFITYTGHESLANHLNRLTKEKNRSAIFFFKNDTPNLPAEKDKFPMVEFRNISEGQSISVEDTCDLYLFPGIIDENILRIAYMSRKEIVILASDLKYMKLYQIKLKNLTACQSVNGMSVSFYPWYIGKPAIEGWFYNATRQIILENEVTGAYLTYERAEKVVKDFISRYHIRQISQYFCKNGFWVIEVKYIPPASFRGLSRRVFRHISSKRLSISTINRHIYDQLIPLLVQEGFLDNRYLPCHSLSHGNGNGNVIGGKQSDSALPMDFTTELTFAGAKGTQKIPSIFQGKPWNDLQNGNLTSVTISFGVIQVDGRNSNNNNHQSWAIAFPSTSFPVPKGSIPTVSGASKLSVLPGTNNLVISRKELDCILKFQIFVFRLLTPFEGATGMLFMDDPKRRESHFHKICCLAEAVETKDRLHYFVLPVEKLGSSSNNECWAIDWDLMDAVNDVENWNVASRTVSNPLEKPEDMLCFCKGFQSFAVINNVYPEEVTCQSKCPHFLNQNITYKHYMEDRFSCKLEDEDQRLVNCQLFHLAKDVALEPEGAFDYASELMLHVPMPLWLTKQLEFIPYVVQRIRRDFFALDILKTFGLPLDLDLELIGSALVTQYHDRTYNNERLEMIGDSLLKFLGALEGFLVAGLKEKRSLGGLCKHKESVISNNRLGVHAAKYLRPYLFYLPLKKTLCNPPFLMLMVERYTCSEWREKVPFPIEHAFSGSMHVYTQYEQLPKISNASARAKKVRNYNIWDKAECDAMEALVGSLVQINPCWAYLFLFRLGHLSEETLYYLIQGDLMKVRPYIERMKREALKNEQLERLLCEPINAGDILEKTSEFIAEIMTYDPLYANIDYESIQEKIGYRYKYLPWLFSALNHESLKSKLSKHLQRSTDQKVRKLLLFNNPLEFLGDALMDWTTINYISALSTDGSPSFLSKMRASLVNNKVFAIISVSIGLHEALIRPECNRLNQEIKEFVAWKEQNSEKEWTDLNVHVPKALADVFEAFVASLLLDVNFNVNACLEILYPILEKHYYAKIGSVGTNYDDMPLIKFSRLQAIITPMAKIHVQFEFSGRIVVCFVTLDGIEISRFGSSQKNTAKWGALAMAIPVLENFGKTHGVDFSRDPYGDKGHISSINQ